MQYFDHLVSVFNGEPLTTSGVIAIGMKQPHANVIKLIRRHLPSLETMGGVRFENQPFETKGGTQTREIAVLNEHQSALLISLMRNSKEVVAFKVRLVSEFFRMRDALQQRDKSLWQKMQALIAQEVESEVRASFGSHLMLERKRDIPAFREQRFALESQIQPSLLN